MTDDLRNEGVARELVKRIQNLRKESGFEITDRIDIRLEHAEQTDKAVAQFHDYITGQVLANSLVLVDKAEMPTELDFEGFKVNITIKKI